MSTADTRFQYVTFDKTNGRAVMRMTNNEKARVKRLKNASTEALRDPANGNQLLFIDLVQKYTKHDAALHILETSSLYASDPLVRSAVNRQLKISEPVETGAVEAGPPPLAGARNGSGDVEDDAPATPPADDADDVVGGATDDLFTQPNLLVELEAAMEGLESLTPTQRRAVTLLRLGQDKFRERLLKAWDRKCAVTGATLDDVLVASHIKPWKVANNDERLDPANGLLLVGTLDRLFDNGFITFEDDGAIRISPRVPEADYRALGLSLSLKLRRVYNESLPFLAVHREDYFRT